MAGNFFEQSSYEQQKLEVFVFTTMLYDNCDYTNINTYASNYIHHNTQKYVLIDAYK